MSQKVGVAVFGMGRMGFQHVKNILMSPRAALKWIVCENIDDANRVKDEYGLTTTHCTTPDNVNQALDDSSVNGVMIVSPTATHENLIKQSLLADKAVFCEKPLTSEINTTKDCYDMAEKSRKPLLCAFQRRFDPSMYKVYSAVRSGVTGPIRLVKSTSRDYPFPPIAYLQTSGGIFKDSTIHDLDICSWMAGSAPVSVTAQGFAHNKELARFGDHDQVVVTIRYENGSMAVIDNGRWSPFGYDQRLEVLCDNTVLTVDNRGQDLVTDAGKKLTATTRVEDSFITRYPEAYRNELEHFINVIQGKEELRVTKEDTVKAMRLAELCALSVKSQATVQYTE